MSVGRLFVSQSVWLSVGRSVRRPACLQVGLNLSAWLAVCLTAGTAILSRLFVVCLSVARSGQPVCLSIGLAVSLPACPYVRLSSCPSVCWSAGRWICQPHHIGCRFVGLSAGRSLCLSSVFLDFVLLIDRPSIGLLAVCSPDNLRSVCLSGRPSVGFWAVAPSVVGLAARPSV